MDARNTAGADIDVVEIGERYCRRWKGNAHLYKRMAGAFWGLSRWREAIRYGRLSLALEHNQSQTVIFMLAAYRADNPGRGIVFGENWLSRHVGDADVWRHLSILYDDVDRRADALATARKGLEQYPQNRRLAACAANYLAKVEGAESALRFASTNHHLFSGDTYCENTLAEGLSAARAYDKSEKIFADLHRREPRDPNFFVSMLDAWFRLGRYREILEAVENWDSHLTTTAAIANEGGRACLELGRPERAMVWMKRACQLAPGNTKFADNYAILLGRVGRHAECIEASLQRLAASGSPDRRRLLKSIAVAYTYLGKHEEALSFYHQTFAEFPSDDDVLIDVMVGLSWLKRYQDEVAFARQYQETRGPKLPTRYWSEFAWALHNLERFREEEEVTNLWSRFHPDDVDVLRVMTRALDSQGRRDTALEYIRTWVDAHPNVAWGWRYLGEQHEKCGGHEAEIEAFAQACRLAPDDPDFAATRLASFRRLNMPKEAFDVGCSWIAAHPNGATADVLNRIGLAADDLEQWESAEEYYRRAFRFSPSSAVFIGNLLRALILLNRAVEATELGRKWIQENDWDNYVAGKQAWALRTAQLVEEEAEILRRAVHADPKNAELSFALLRNLLLRKRADEATTFFGSCRTSGVVTSQFSNDWGNLLRDHDRFVEAEEAYRIALEIAPDNEIAGGNLASLMIILGREEEAIWYCREWLARRPDDRYVRRQLAEAFYAKNDFESAEPEFLRLVELEPNSSFLFGRLTACRRLVGKFEHALVDSTRWLQQNAGTAFLYVEMGISAHRLNKLGEALEHFEAALRLDQSSSAAAVRKFLVLDEQGRSDLALEFGQQWKSAHPDEIDPEFHNRLGILLDHVGRTEEAEQCFLRATQLDPSNPTLAGNAVEFLTRRQRLEESIQLGHGFLAGNPPNAYLLRRLAEAYSTRSEHGAALGLLETADVLDPRDPDVVLAFLRISVDAEEIERGVKFGRAWLARLGNEQRADVWAQLARVCFRADFDDEAFESLKRATEIAPDEISYVRLSFSFWRGLGESNQVIEAFGSLRRDWQDDPQLLKIASWAYCELGLKTEALRMAERNAAANPADDEACAWLVELQDEFGQTDSARSSLSRWIDLYGEQPAVLTIRAEFEMRQERYSAALADAEKVLGHDKSDEKAFIICIRALRGLRRDQDARARLNHWIEHHGSSKRIDRLLDEKSDDQTF